ncbi:unnamed protein product [Penicillium glandicola]
MQWRRIMWDLRGESLGQYRRKLESHLDAINLLLNTLIWSATDRIEQDGVRQGRRIEELLHQASHFNNTLFHMLLKQPRTARNSSFEFSRDPSSSVSSTVESVPSRARPRLHQDPVISFMGSQHGHAGFSNGIRA